MIYIDSKKTKLTSSHFNQNKSGGRANRKYASIGDSKVHIFRRPEHKLPKTKYNEDGSRTIVMGQKGVSFEPRYTLVQDNNTTDVVYTERPPVMKNGEIETAVPAFLEFKESATIIVDSKAKPDLWWFMYNHPRCANGPNHDPSRRAMFELINPEAEDLAELAAYKAEMEVTKTLIAMSDEKALEACMILKLGKKGMKPELAKPKLKQRAKTAPEIVFKAIMVAQQDQRSHDMSTLLMKMNDLGVAAFDVKSQAWYLLNPNRRLGEKIIKVSTAQDPKEVMSNFLNAPENAELLLKISSAVEIEEKALQLS